MHDATEGTCKSSKFPDVKIHKYILQNGVRKYEV